MNPLILEHIPINHIMDCIRSKEDKEMIVNATLIMGTIFQSCETSYSEELAINEDLFGVFSSGW
jgi:hypothetical protein